MAATKKSMALATKEFRHDEPGNPNWKIHHACCSPRTRVWRPGHFPCLPMPTKEKVDD